MHWHQCKIVYVLHQIVYSGREYYGLSSWRLLHQIVIKVVVGIVFRRHLKYPSRHEQVEGVECLLPGEIVVQIAVGNGVDTYKGDCTLDDARGIQDDTVARERLDNLLVAFLFQYLI